jgi:hypothetical protein
MTEGYDKKSKLAMEHGHVPIELTVITLNDKKSNDRRQVMSKNVRVQTDQTGMTRDAQQTNGRQQVKGKDVDVQTEKTMNKDVDVQTEKIMNKDVDVQTEQTEITIDDQQNDRQVMSTDINIQAELTAIMLDDEQTNDLQHSVNTNVEINSDLSHRFDGPHVITNGEEILDQSQVAVAIEDSDTAPDASLINNRRIVETVNEAANLRTTNIINDISIDLGPIVGYAEEPLLPLFKACAPLTDIIHNLSFYIQIAINETPEVPPNGLTIDESASIRLYTMEWDGPHRSLYSMLNHTLKKDDREHLRPYFKYLKLFLTALVKLPCVPPLTIWRGVKKNSSAEFSPGTPVTWWAFASCTTELTVLESNIYLGTTGERTLFSVEAINGRTVRAHSHFVIEDEILLLPGTYMIVQSQFSPAPDLHIIHLKQVIPEEVLLEPPFEGSLNIFKHLFSIAAYLYIGARLYPKPK